MQLYSDVRLGLWLLHFGLVAIDPYLQQRKATQPHAWNGAAPHRTTPHRTERNAMPHHATPRHATPRHAPRRATPRMSAHRTGCGLPTTSPPSARAWSKSSGQCVPSCNKKTRASSLHGQRGWWGLKAAQNVYSRLWAAVNYLSREPDVDQGHTISLPSGSAVHPVPNGAYGWMPRTLPN